MDPATDSPPDPPMGPPWGGLVAEKGAGGGGWVGWDADENAAEEGAEENAAEEGAEAAPGE